jgi:hypothetical protein
VVTKVSKVSGLIIEIIHRHSECLFLFPALTSPPICFCPEAPKINCLVLTTYALKD